MTAFWRDDPPEPTGRVFSTLGPGCVLIERRAHESEVRRLLADLLGNIRPTPAKSLRYPGWRASQHLKGLLAEIEKGDARLAEHDRKIAKLRRS